MGDGNVDDVAAVVAIVVTAAAAASNVTPTCELEYSYDTVQLFLVVLVATNSRLRRGNQRLFGHMNHSTYANTQNKTKFRF